MSCARISSHSYDGPSDLSPMTIWAVNIDYQGSSLGKTACCKLGDYTGCTKVEWLRLYLDSLLDTNNHHVPTIYIPYIAIYIPYIVVEPRKAPLRFLNQTQLLKLGSVLKSFCFPSPTMKREATSSPDDGPKKEKRKYIRKPKAPTGAQPSGAEAPASSLMDVVWGDSSPVTNNGNSLPNPQVVPAIEKDEKGNTKGASAAGKVVKGKGKAGLDGKKGKQASDSGNDLNRDGEGNTLVEGKKSTAGQCFCPSWNSALIKRLCHSKLVSACT
jgi:hypothetical protein